MGLRGNGFDFGAILPLVQTYPLPLRAQSAVRCWPLLWPSHFCIVIIGSKTGRTIAIGASLRRCAPREVGCSGTCFIWARSTTAKGRRGPKSRMCLIQSGIKPARWPCIRRIGRCPSTPASMACKCAWRSLSCGVRGNGARAGWDASCGISCSWRSFGATGCLIRGRAPAGVMCCKR